MKRSESTFKPLSLAQHFEPPEEYIGTFGWVCGYSADIGFLNDAVERFTGRTHAQRAYEGRIAIALMLDPGNQQILPVDVPGILHLPILAIRPFRLLHAKVALLGFRHASEVRRWHLRLLVSTGNWTRETLEQSLDLVWRLDLFDHNLKGRDDAVTQTCADLSAVWNLLTWLREHFDDRALNAKAPGRREMLCQWDTIERWIADAARLAKHVRSRFFDNRSTSLLAQLPDLVQIHASQSARNYLAMGSGFYEASAEANTIPSVLANIVRSLQDANLLTQRPTTDVFVNPEACQAVATSVPWLDAAGWKVRPPSKPDYFKGNRSLHAKFIFSAIDRGNSDLCNSAWLYLGSGNLTGPGVDNPMSPHGGNLEVGVVFAPDSLHWYAAKGVEPQCVLTNLLPLQWEIDFGKDQGTLAAGSDMPDPELHYSAAPVAYFFWIVEGAGGWLRASEELPESVDVLNTSGHACQRDAAKGFQWIGVRPRQVQVRWRVEEQQRHSWVPVLDEFGRFAATALPQIEIEEAWGQLDNFPMPPADEELSPNGEPESPDGPTEQSTGGHFTSRYPVRQMMELVENIAAKQRESHRRERFREHLISRIDQGMTEIGNVGLIPKMIFDAFRRSVREATNSPFAEHRSLALVSRAILELLGSSDSDASPLDCARAFCELILAASDRDDADDDSEIDDVRADELWQTIEDRLSDEYDRPQGGFARLMYGNTSQASRQMIQLAFNRRHSFPHVLVAQSLVGREGLNLHRACRIVVLLHPEWNPGVVEQQIGRVDRVDSHWCREIKKAIENGMPGDQFPRIEVRPVIFRGTYDEHNWQVLRCRWDELRAQLHGIVITTSEIALDPESKALIDEICYASPDFSPTHRQE